jgi:hypothetical protein
MARLIVGVGLGVVLPTLTSYVAEVSASTGAAETSDS